MLFLLQGAARFGFSELESDSDPSVRNTKTSVATPVPRGTSHSFRVALSVPKDFKATMFHPRMG
jgi:hypothetical protein